MWGKVSFSLGGPGSENWMRGDFSSGRPGSEAPGRGSEHLQGRRPLCRPRGDSGSANLATLSFLLLLFVGPAVLFRQKKTRPVSQTCFALEFVSKVREPLNEWFPVGFLYLQKATSKGYRQKDTANKLDKGGWVPSKAVTRAPKRKHGKCTRLLVFHPGVVLSSQARGF